MRNCMYLLETFRLVHVLHQAPFCQNLILEECGVKWNFEQSSSNSNKAMLSYDYDLI